MPPKQHIINAKRRKELKGTDRELRKSPWRDGTPVGSQALAPEKRVDGRPLRGQKVP